MEPPRVIARGFSATTYDTLDGYVVRAAHDEDARRRHLREAALLPVIKDRLVGYELPVPTEVLPRSAKYPYGAIRCPLLSGEHPDGSIDPSSVAAFLRMLHAVPQAWVHDVVEPYEVWFAGQVSTAADGTAALSRNLDQETALWLTRFVEELPALLRSTSMPALVHGDFWSENLLTRGLRLAAILDWEAAAIGDVAVDIAGLWYLGPALPLQVAAELGWGGDLIRRAQCFRVIRELFGAAWSDRRNDLQELSESAIKVVAVVRDVRTNGIDWDRGLIEP